MPTLRELDGHFIICREIRTDERDSEGMYVFREDDGEIFMWSPRPERYEYLRTDSLAEAHGLWMDCPLCHMTGLKHGVIIPFAGRTAPHVMMHNGRGQPVYWNVAGGTGLDDLSLTPSIQLLGGCNWHGFVGSSGVPPGHAA